MKKKILLITNFLTLGLLAFFIIREGSQSKRNELCSYSLDDFDFHFKRDPESPSIILLGNSLIRHGKWDSLLHRSDISNRGISGDKLGCMLDRLKYLQGSSAKICFIEGGINDLPATDIDTLFNRYTRIVSFWKAKKVIPVINLVLYISPKAGINYPYRKDYIAINTLIRNLNKKLREFAAVKKIEVIDLNPILCDEHLMLLKDEFTLDGIHITNSAYSIWASKMEAVLDKYGIGSSL
jgi:lysophospholipase L1-like esterase